MENVTEEMRLAGNTIAHDLIVGNCAKAMNGLGGSLSYEQWVNEHSTNPNKDLLIAYVNDEIDSVTAIYLAMKRAKQNG